MEYITKNNGYRCDVPSVVVIGKFDGVHRGHKKLVETAKKYRNLEGKRLIAVTFDGMPFEGKCITTNEERRELLEESGVDILVEYSFTKEFTETSAEDFIRDYLVDRLRAGVIVAGTDCGFGKGRKGNIALLKEKEVLYGYETVVVDKEKEGGREISSTYVREELLLGNVENAANLMGREYFIRGVVTEGNRIGRTLDFPTANLVFPREKVVPKYGVYASHIYYNGRTYKGISNIGVKPTISSHETCGVETYLFDFDEDIYGKEITVSLSEYIRGEQKFAGLAELKAQVDRDIQFVKNKA